MEYTRPIKFDGLIKSIKSFIYGYYFPVCVSAWAFICFILNLQTLGFLVLLVSGTLILISVSDITPIIPLFTGFILLVKSYAPLITLPYFIAYGFLVLCFVIHYIRFPIKSLYLGKLFFPLCLVTAALFLGGTLSSYVSIYANGLVTAFSIGPAVLVIYFVFLNGARPPKNIDLKIYLCVSLIAATVFAGFEIIYIALNDYSVFINVFNLGWGNFNTFGAMVLIAVPLCGYLMAKTGKITTMLSVITFLVASDILCGSDGSSGIVLFSLPFIAVCVYFNVDKKHRKKLCYYAFFAVFAVMIAGLAISIKGKFEEIIEVAVVHANSNGRSNLFHIAMSLFKSNPLLGIGLGFNDESVYVTSPDAFNFHSTFSNVAATMGIFGLAAYTVYYFFRFRIIMGGRSSFNVFVFLSFIMFEAYGIVDVCEFNLIPLMSYITILLAVTESTNGKAEDSRLPLSRSKISF